jgi:hypothetical protein
LDEYEFSTFLESLDPVIDSMKDIHNPITFMENLDAEASQRQGALEAAAVSKKVKQHLKDRAGRLAAQIGKFRFWLATGGRPGEMPDADFDLIEPICRNLVDKGILRPSALDIFRAAPRGY